MDTPSTLESIKFRHTIAFDEDDPFDKNIIKFDGKAIYRIEDDDGNEEPAFKRAGKLSGYYLNRYNEECTIHD